MVSWFLSVLSLLQAFGDVLKEALVEKEASFDAFRVKWEHLFNYSD